MEGGWVGRFFIAPKVLFCLKGLNVLAVCFDLSQKVASVFFPRKSAPNTTHPEDGDLLVGKRSNINNPKVIFFW